MGVLDVGGCIFELVDRQPGARRSDRHVFRSARATVVKAAIVASAARAQARAARRRMKRKRRPTESAGSPKALPRRRTTGARSPKPPRRHLHADISPRRAARILADHGDIDGVRARARAVAAAAGSRQSVRQLQAAARTKRRESTPAEKPATRLNRRQRGPAGYGHSGHPHRPRAP